MTRIRLFIVFLPIALFSLCSSSANETTFLHVAKTRFKILGIFGHLGKSHFDVFKPLLEELARRGHEITVLSHFPRIDKAKESLPTYKDISLLDPNVGVYVDIINLQRIQQTSYRILIDLYRLRTMADNACNSGLRNPIVAKFLRSDEQFDIILTERFNTDCFLGFVHRFKAPYLSLSSHQIMPWTNVDIGNDDDPSSMPMIFLGLARPMDLLGRIKNAMALQLTKVAYEYWFRRKDQAIADEVFGPNLPKLEEIAKRSQALLVNTHSSLHGSRSFPPNVVEIGGLHIPRKIKSLPKDVAEFLDNAPEGVLYFNLGSMIKSSSMPRRQLDAILDAIDSIPRKVLLKWESNELPRRMDTVMARKWLPQFDVLSKYNKRANGSLLYDSYSSRF